MIFGRDRACLFVYYYLARPCLSFCLLLLWVSSLGEHEILVRVLLSRLTNLSSSVLFFFINNPPVVLEMVGLWVKEKSYIVCKWWLLVTTHRMVARPDPSLFLLLHSHWKWDWDILIAKWREGQVQSYPSFLTKKFLVEEPEVPISRYIVAEIDTSGHK